MLSTEVRATLVSMALSNVERPRQTILGCLPVHLFTKFYQGIPWWQIAGLRFASRFQAQSREQPRNLADDELAQRFHRLLDSEDVEEVFREFLVPPPVDD
jgi:hypothetical protein